MRAEISVEHRHRGVRAAFDNGWVSVCVWVPVAVLPRCVHARRASHASTALNPSIWQTSLDKRPIDYDTASILAAARVSTNGHNLDLVFSDIRIEDAPAAYAPFTTGEPFWDGKFALSISP